MVRVEENSPGNLVIKMKAPNMYNIMLWKELQAVKIYVFIKMLRIVNDKSALQSL